MANLPKALKAFSDFLGTKSWLVGDNITYPDFHLYEMLDQHKMFKADCLKEYANLEAYCDRSVVVVVAMFRLRIMERGFEELLVN